MNDIEIIEIKEWKYKIRSTTNRKKWYNIIQRKDLSFYCTCNSYIYQTNKCKHIKALQKVV